MYAWFKRGNVRVKVPWLRTRLNVPARDDDDDDDDLFKVEDGEVFAQSSESEACVKNVWQTKKPK